MAAQMKYGDYIKGGLEIFKANLVPSVVAVLCMMIPFVGLLVMINYMAGVKAAKHEGKPIAIGDLFNFENAVDKIVGPFLVMVLVQIGASIFFIPGLIVGGLFVFVSPIIADRPGTNFLDAMKGSLHFAKANLVPCILLQLVIGLVMFAGFMCCVGGFVTMPIALAASFLAYEDHKSAVQAAAAEGGVQL
ncbi:MAG: hypothetical protein KIT58_08260 [Planctomycetota bacterium]|nr:hypothetical protein [Planctomycetota bacterium]